MKAKCPYCRFWFKTEDELAMHLYPTHKYDLSLPVAKIAFKIEKFDNIPGSKLDSHWNAFDLVEEFKSLFG